MFLETILEKKRNLNNFRKQFCGTILKNDFELIITLNMILLFQILKKAFKVSVIFLYENLY